jgi:hypothetical protein
MSESQSLLRGTLEPQFPRVGFWNPASTRKPFSSALFPSPSVEALCRGSRWGLLEVLEVSIDITGCDWFCPQAGGG